MRVSLSKIVLPGHLVCVPPASHLTLPAGSVVSLHFFLGVRIELAGLPVYLPSCLPSFLSACLPACVSAWWGHAVNFHFLCCLTVAHFYSKVLFSFLSAILSITPVHRQLLYLFMSRGYPACVNSSPLPKIYLSRTD